MARILIVDDAKFMRMTLSNMLTKAGHEIVGEGEMERMPSVYTVNYNLI